jgi:hypothetical protein
VLRSTDEVGREHLQEYLELALEMRRRVKALLGWAFAGPLRRCSRCTALHCNPGRVGWLKRRNDCNDPS